MTAAGGSARAEYERRRANDRERRRRTFKTSLVLVLLAPAAAYVAVQAVTAGLNEWLVSSLPLPEPGASGSTVIVDASTAHRFGLLFGAIALMRAAIALWGARQTTEAWRKGYEGEVMTAAVLQRLPASYVVLHDLRLPRSRANIDHVVIGPTGVFTVETKHYSSGVLIRRGEARHAGRSMDRAVDQANRQAEAVRAVLGCPVRALVCVQGAEVEVESWFARPVVDGVRFCSGGRLVRAITKLDHELDPAEVRQLSEAARRAFSRSSTASITTTSDDPPACRCGSDMVLRHRRADGAPFWGCSRFPDCRHTIAA